MATSGDAESPVFPVAVSDVVRTLVDLFKHQGKAEIVGLLEGASATLAAVDYDNLDGGSYIWALWLDVPVPLFASIEPRLAKVEDDINTKLQYLSRPYPNDHLSVVSIRPLTSGSAALARSVAPPEFDVRRIWPADLFRLFLSHVATHKVAVSALKDELEYLGVGAFVAHEDIEPNREWRKEIELALRSMHAMSALITPEFHASRWTDQEVGWALGRGVPVLPVRLGADPQGFAGHVQALSGALNRPATLAAAIVDVLLRESRTHHEMKQALVVAVRDAASFRAAKALKPVILSVQDFTENQKATLRDACASNVEIRDAYGGVADAIYSVVGRPPKKRPAPPPSDDDLPF